MTSSSLKTRVAAIADKLDPSDAAVIRELLDSWDDTLPPGAKSTAESASTGKETVKTEYAQIEFGFLEQFMRDVFEAVGVPSEEAKIAADVLIFADRRGIDSHGIGRLRPIYIQRIRAGILKPTAKFEVVSEGPTTAVVDGHGGLGLYIGPRCMDMCIKKAKEYGIAMVVTRNSTHYGAAGWYANHAQEHGCIGITGTNARPSIAPTFGVQPMLGTNPITFGLPTDDGFPFLLDCATSVNQRGKIEKYAREGLPTPPGQVVDRSGKIRTDTEGILRDLVTGECSLAPLGGVGVDMGGYKGYGYATVVELLSSALCDGKTSPELSGVDKATGNKIPMPLGHFFIAISIEKFLPVEKFKANAGNFLRAVRASDKDPTGPGRIWTAGEIENDVFVERSKTNCTPVPTALQNDMLELREQYEVLKTKYPKFSFEA